MLFTLDPVVHSTARRQYYMAQETGIQTSERTVVGVFDDYNSAKQAARELANAGIDESAINIQSEQKTGAAGRSASFDSEGAHTGSDEGGFTGWLHRVFGGDESEHGSYTQAVSGGATVLSVDVAGTQVERAADILNRYGATDVERDADRRATSGRTDVAGSTSVPVIEEELQVGKRVVKRGGVRIYSRVVEQPVEERINLREEHVRVERRPADRPVDRGELGRLRDQTIEVTETVEEPVISKRARVKEEVVVGKEATERTDTIRDTVRHTEVKVDSLDANTFDANTEDATNDPAYQYGYRWASDPRYTGRSWTDAEDEMRTSYMRDNPGGAWEQAKSKVRRGWEHVTGQR